MKVSLKYKLPFFILLAFILFITLLLLYYRLFLMRDLGRDFDIFKDHLYRISEEVATQIKSNYPDRSKTAKFLEDVSEQQNVKITIYDVDGNKIISADRRKGYGLNLELKSFIVARHNDIYVIELVYPFSIENFSELNSFKKIRDAALVLLGLLIILLIVYLHFFLVRPLTMLNRKLETINYRNADLTIPHNTHRRNDELGDLDHKFSEMQQRLVASYREQTEMIASISHDLKTPLTSIIGFLERLENQNISEDRQIEYHRIIYQKAQDIRELIMEFNEYVISDLDDTSSCKERIRLPDFFEIICVEYKAELAIKAIDFFCNHEINDTDELWVEMNTQKIRRVFANLVNNSLQHAEGLSKITFKCMVQKNQVIFTVEDDGPGVPPEQLGAIFDKFYRVDKSRSREKGGSGLGLAICQRIIENHRGSIRAYLTHEGGLGVSFSLPLKNVYDIS